MKIGIALLASLLTTSAVADTLEYSQTNIPADSGYPHLQHRRLQLTTVVDGTQLSYVVERKQFAGSPPAASAEVLISRSWTPRLYTMTRLSRATSTRLFTTNGAYQEFGLKAADSGSLYLDLNAGLGTRTFPAGKERFIAYGPTFSLPNAGLWLRREQSLSGGGVRDSVSLRVQPQPQWAVELAWLDEKREKFILPMLAPVLNGQIPGVSGRRQSVRIEYERWPGWAVLVGGEWQQQSRDDLGLVYYSPASFTLGVIRKY